VDEEEDEEEAGLQLLASAMRLKQSTSERAVKQSARQAEKAAQLRDEAETRRKLEARRAEAEAARAEQRYLDSDETD
jgi:hypothetical protein